MAAAFDFPVTDRLGKAVVEKNFVRVTDRRAENPHLHFALFLPKVWRPMDLPAETPALDKGPVRLALYHPDGKTPDDAAIEIAVAAMSREVDPADWLDTFLEMAGVMVIARRDAATEGGNCPDRLTLSVDAKTPTVARWFVRKNGPNLFIVQARAHIDRYPRLADVFFFAITQFALLQPYDWPLAESLATFSRHDPGNFLIMYPASWQRPDDPPNHPTFLQVKLLNRIEEKSVGQMDFVALGRTPEMTPAKILDNLMHALAKADVLAAKPRLEKGPPADDLAETWQAVFPAVAGKQFVEVRLFVGQRAEWCYTLTLISPNRETMPSVWAINKRAFEIVLKYLKTAPPGGGTHQ